MLVGYMRVSSDTDRPTTDLQRDALLEAGVDPRQLFADKASGARDDRPGLQQALAYVQPGDCLVVGKLDRLGRSESWTGIGVAAGCAAVRLITQGPHMKHIAGYWRMPLLHILQRVGSICKACNQLYHHSRA